LVDGAGETDDVTVAGVALGDMVIGASLGVDLVGLTVTGYVCRKHSQVPHSE
jgi:putative N-acetylmannosamine-6-phosphate epimerase